MPINKALIPCFIVVSRINYHIRGRGQTLTLVSHKPARKVSHVIEIDRVDILEEGCLVMEICTPMIHTYDRPWIRSRESRPIQRGINYGIQAKLDLAVAKKVYQCVSLFDVHCAEHPLVTLLGHDGPLIFLSFVSGFIVW